MKKQNPILAALFSVDIMVGSAMLALLIILTVLGVFFRYALNKPFTWLEEVQLACMVWITFSAAGAAFRYGNHVAIEMVVDLFPKKVQKIIEVLIAIIVTVVLLYFCYKSIAYIQVFLKSGRSTPMLRIPYAVIYGIAPVMSILMLVSYYYSLITNVKSEAKEAIAENG